ncbi:MAG TPA: hypothetical protein VG735_12810 [Caulobacterales bacterium]|jgi:hypothetical protein|nr:hypothetical protein [Caulobacterales bacterium]
MQHNWIAALRYGATRLELSLLAVAVFSALIAVALGVHYGTVS